MAWFRSVVWVPAPVLVKGNITTCVLYKDNLNRTTWWKQGFNPLLIHNRVYRIKSLYGGGQESCPDVIWTAQKANTASKCLCFILS